MSSGDSIPVCPKAQSIRAPAFRFSPRRKSCSTLANFLLPPVGDGFLNPKLDECGRAAGAPQDFVWAPQPIPTPDSSKSFSFKFSYSYSFSCRDHPTHEEESTFLLAPLDHRRLSG